MNRFVSKENERGASMVSLFNALRVVNRAALNSSECAYAVTGTRSRPVIIVGLLPESTRWAGAN